MFVKDKRFSISFKVKNLEDSSKSIIKNIYSNALYIYDDETEEIVKNYKPEFKVHISDNLEVIADFETIIFILGNNDKHLDIIQVIADKYIGKMIALDNIYSTSTNESLLDIVHSVMDYSLSDEDEILINITSSSTDIISELYDKIKGTPYIDRLEECYA